MMLGDAFLVHPAPRLPRLEMGVLRCRFPDPARCRPEAGPEVDCLVETLAATVLSVMRHLHVIAIEISPVLCQTFVATFDAGVSENHDRFGVVPETATLIITGEGIINTSGGNAGNGGRGGNGGSGSLTPIRGGVGGYGVQGGGGAGAGIGGCGGAGGSGGETMGNVYILGSMNINATKGKTGASGVSGSAGGAALSPLIDTSQMWVAFAQILPQVMRIR